MLINVQLPGVQAEHVVGIAPQKVSETHCVQYNLIDGSHPLWQPMEFSCENMDWCFDEFDKILSGICFLPLVARSLEIVKSNGFEPNPGRQVCLAHDDAVPPSFWIKKCGNKRPDELHESFQVTCDNVQEKKISK